MYKVGPKSSDITVSIRRYSAYSESSVGGAGRYKNVTTEFSVLDFIRLLTPCDKNQLLNGRWSLFLLCWKQDIKM